MPRLPYEGIKILDFTWGAVGTVAVRFLSDWGAEAILVETYRKPSLNRTAGPFWANVVGVERGGWWHVNYNASKRSLSLNLDHPKANEVMKRLITEWKPNILAESYTPGAMKRLNLDYETVKEWKPDIIYYSTCMEGQTGPHKDRMGYGNVATSLAGPNFYTGWPDRDPSGLYGAYSDCLSATAGNNLMVAALFYQRKTGKGLWIDQSQYESVIRCLAPPLMDYFLTGRVMERAGNRVPDAAPHGAFPCKGDDRWVAIAVFTDEEWGGFCRVIGNPEWTKEPKFATLMGRKANEDVLERLVGEWTIDFAAEQVEAMMQAGGVAANVVENAQDYMEDPQIKHYNAMPEFDHPLIGKTRIYGPAMKLSKCPDGVSRAPTMGEHNRNVLHDILGMSDDEIADLMVEGAISTEADLPEPPKKEE